MSSYLYVYASPQMARDPSGRISRLKLGAPVSTAEPLKVGDKIPGHIAGSYYAVIGFVTRIETMEVRTDDPLGHVEAVEKALERLQEEAREQYRRDLPALLAAAHRIPWDPGHRGHIKGVIRRCTFRDSCPILSRKITYLEAVLLSHVADYLLRGSWSHETEIRQFYEMLANCRCIHKAKCTGLLPKSVRVRVRYTVPKLKYHPPEGLVPVRRIYEFYKRTRIIPIIVPFPIPVPARGTPVPVLAG